METTIKEIMVASLFVIFCLCMVIYIAVSGIMAEGLNGYFSGTRLVGYFGVIVILGGGGLMLLLTRLIYGKEAFK